MRVFNPREQRNKVALLPRHATPAFPPLHPLPPAILRQPDCEAAPWWCGGQDPVQQARGGEEHEAVVQGG